MFSFLKKPEAIVEDVKPQADLPEGCEALFDCEFAEISGAGTPSHMAL